MRHLFKRFLKPFIASVVAVVLLLAVQALCDLNLPNFMSYIVNVGIQQGGIEEKYPLKMPIKSFDQLSAFADDEQKNELLSSYMLEDGCYVIKGDLGQDAQKKLEKDFGVLTWTLMEVQKEPTLSIDSARAMAQKMDPQLMGQSSTILIKQIYQELGIDMGKLETDYILRVGIFMLLLTIISGVATILVSFFSSRVGAGVARDLRNAVFAKVASFSNEEFDRFSTASLITRSTNDVTQIQMLLTIGLRMIFYSPLMGIGGVIMATSKSLSMSWIIGLAVALLIGLMVALFVVVMPKFKIVQILVDRVNLVARETLNGQLVIRAFGRERFDAERFDVANSDLTKVNLFVNRAMTFMFPMMMLIMNGISVIIIWVGAHSIAESQMQVGDMMAYMQYAMQIIMSFMFMSMMFYFIPRAQVSARRINEIINTVPSITDPENPESFSSSEIGKVQFKNVSFKYPEAEDYALKNISFTAAPGHTLAFIGSTGSGKTTIMNLIPRFYDATEGEIIVGGVDVRELRQKDLRAAIGYVPQKSILVSGTIASNIGYGNEDMTEDQMRTIAMTSQAIDFIEENDEGYGAAIAQGGQNVSGGQRQRLSIARALAVKPSIYLFDDSFSALDFSTDAKLRTALSEYANDATLIIVAQRVSTIMDADEIIVIDDGEVAGRGHHLELIKTCSQYYEIASSQLSEEDIAAQLSRTTDPITGATTGARTGATTGAEK